MYNVCDVSQIQEDSNCFTQAESQGDTHPDPLWTTKTGLLVSLAWTAMVLAVFLAF